MGSCEQLVKLPTQSKEYSRLSRMSTIKLTYFDLRARAEPCRLLLAYAGSKYEDERLPAPWDNMAPWTTLKPNTPWGQVPLLSWDGEVIAQSMACARFLAGSSTWRGGLVWRWRRWTRSLMLSRIFSMLGIHSTMPRTLLDRRSSWRQTSPPPWGSWRRSWRAGGDSSWWAMLSPGLTSSSSST